MIQSLETRNPSEYYKGFMLRPVFQGLEAEYSDGVLKLTLPKKAGTETKKLEIK